MEKFPRVRQKRKNSKGAAQSVIIFVLLLLAIDAILIFALMGFGFTGKTSIEVKNPETVDSDFNYALALFSGEYDWCQEMCGDFVKDGLIYNCEPCPEPNGYFTSTTYGKGGTSSGGNGGDDDVTCYIDNNCGIDYFSDNYCSGGNVARDFVEYVCSNPGETSSSCGSNTIKVAVQTCAFGCDNGKCNDEPNECVRDSDCGEDEFCDDGTCEKKDDPECERDSDCGEDEFCDNGTCKKDDPETKNVLMSLLAISRDDCSLGWNSLPSSIFGYDFGGSFHTWHTHIVEGICEQSVMPNLAMDYLGNYITHGWMELQTVDDSAKFTIIRDDCAGEIGCDGFPEGIEYDNCPGQLGNDYVGHGIFHVGLVEETCNKDMAFNFDGDEIGSGWMRLCSKDNSARLIIRSDDCSGAWYGNCADQLGDEYFDAGKFHVGSDAYCDSNDDFNDEGYVYMASSWETGEFRSLESGWVTMCSKKMDVEF